MIDFIDIFNGVDGFRNGLEGAGGYRCVWSCDNDKWANAIHAANYGEAGHHPRDIREVDAGDIPNHELLCSGFPCQPYSTSGKKKGLEDPRGKVFYEITRIAKRKRPRLLLLENVPGLLNHNGGATYWTMLRELGLLGYRCEWQIINTYWWGPPQDRDRLFIIGHLGAEPGPQVFPVAEDDLLSRGQGGRQEVEPLAQALRSRDYMNWRGNFVLEPVHVAPSLAGALTGGGGHGQGLHSDMTIVIDQLNGRTRDDGLTGALKGNMASSGPAVALCSTNPHNKEEERSIHPKELAPALKASRGNQQPLVLTIAHGYYRGGLKLMPCLRANRGYTYNELVSDGYWPRRFTPVECERLHGFKEGWTAKGIMKGREIEISDTQRYRLLGNAVSPPVIRFLGERIRRVMG